MAYDQGQYQQAPSRGYYSQQAPRGAPRPREPPQRGQPYAEQYNDYGHEGGGGGGQHYPQQDSYQGYDRDSFWDSYGGNTSGYDQQYHQDEYGQAQNYQNYNNPPQQRRPPQQPRQPMQRREDYPPRGRGYGPMGGPMGGPPPGGRGRGPPPQGYPPQNYGPPRGGMPQYDDRRQMRGPQSDSPPRQKQRLIPVSSPQTTNFDNPFPIFPGGQVKPKTDAEIAEQAMSGLDLNGRPSQDQKRPPTSGSAHSQGSSRSNYARHPGDPRGERRPSEDRYGPRPPFDNRGPPGRAMTMPQDIEYPGNNRRINQEQNWPEAGYDAGYGPGKRDPIQDRSNTTLGDRPIAAMQAPQRPSTATGMRPGPNMQRNEFAGDMGGRPAFSPPFAQNMPPRPGTSQGYHGAPAPAPLQVSRPPMRSKESELEAWMPDFDTQADDRPLRDAIGIPLDAAPEALKPLARVATAPADANGFSQQVHNSRSQSDLRSQANGYAYGNPADAPMVPKVPPNMAAGPYAGRGGPLPLATNNVQAFNSGMNGAGSMPNSPRHFHRPGAPPIQRNETAQSGWSDPGPNPGNSLMGGPGPRPNGAPNPPVPKSANPDALPAHPTPIRPGLMAGGAPGPAQIRQAQAQRQSTDSPRGSLNEKRMSVPITIEEINRLRETVRANPTDQKQALLLAKKLVEAARVLANEGGRIVDERAIQKNREKYIFEAHKHIKRLVSSNYADAMFYLADCYGTGQLGLAVDPKEAFGLYQAAAKLGHGASAYRTAVCCEMGLEAGGGTRKDALKAVQWYKRAAALGDTPAMYKLGMILLKGLLGQQASLGEAMIWLQRAADKADEENPHALHELAQLYEHAPNGGKVIRDEGYALQLYQQAAKLGYRTSQARLGKAYEYGHLGCAIDNRSSIHWYAKAAAQEDHDAELALSGWYLTGSQGILQASDQEAYLWARKAALAELPKAEFAMGYFSETGIGCPKSLEDAKRWYGRAAGHKYPKAQQRLEELIRGGGKNLKNRERMSRGDEKKHEDCVLM